MAWCAERGIEVRYIQPGKSNQNAFIERFNRTYRTEVLNAYVFDSLDQVRDMSAEWLQTYNEERPHNALAGLPPAHIGPILKPEVLLGQCLLDRGVTLLILRIWNNDVFHNLSGICMVEKYRRK